MTDIQTIGYGSGVSRTVGMYDDNGTLPTTLMASAAYTDGSAGVTQTVTFASSVSVTAGFKWLALSPTASGGTTFRFQTTDYAASSNDPNFSTAYLPAGSLMPASGSGAVTCQACAGPELFADWVCP